MKQLRGAHTAFSCVFQRDGVNDSSRSLMKSYILVDILLLLRPYYRHWYTEEAKNIKKEIENIVSVCNWARFSLNNNF